MAATTSPAIISRNSAQVTPDNVVVYWASPKGELIIAPDSRITQRQIEQMPEYRHWKRCEATGVKEIEKVSLIISRQAFEKKKGLKVQQHLREKFFLDQLQIRCKLRLAQGFSKNDEDLNRKILNRAQKTEDTLYAVIASEFDPSRRTTALEMELKEQSTSPLANVGGKHQGVA